MKWFDREIETIADFFQTIELIFTGKEANLPTPGIFFKVLDKKILELENRTGAEIFSENTDPTENDGMVGDLWINITTTEVFKKAAIEFGSWQSTGFILETQTVEDYIDSVIETLIDDRFEQLLTEEVISFSEYSQFKPKLIVCTEEYFSTLPIEVQNDPNIVYIYVTTTTP